MSHRFCVGILFSGLGERGGVVDRKIKSRRFCVGNLFGVGQRGRRGRGNGGVFWLEHWKWAILGGEKVMGSIVF